MQTAGIRQSAGAREVNGERCSGGGFDERFRRRSDRGEEALGQASSRRIVIAVGLLTALQRLLLQQFDARLPFHLAGFGRYGTILT